MIKVLLLVLAALVAGCTAAARSTPVARDKDPGAVMGKTWQWESTVAPADKVAPRNPEQYTISFGQNGRLQARFDCNSGGGGYKIAAGKLSFGQLMSTRMACAPDSQEGPFMRALGLVESFFVEDGQLFLGLKGNSGTMRFRPAP